MAERVTPPTSTALVLASSSPRRRDLLREAGYAFRIVSPDVDESPLPDESPRDTAVRLAHAKAARVARELDAREVALAADTVVVLDGEAFGKPCDPDDAAAMLRRLSARVHLVYTGYAVATRDAVEASADHTRVHFRALSEGEIAAYVASGEPLDKAGAYGLQGAGGSFVARLEGSRSNVIGLPLERVIPLLRGRGVEPEPARAGPR